MFERLDDIDWSSHDHVYGSAIDVPDMLRSWTGIDVADRRRAVESLWSSLFHQGGLHPTAAIVAPFLIEVLRSDRTELFADAYLMLDHMIDPMVPAWEADGFRPDEHEMPACYWAAADALDVYIACLEPSTSAPLGTMIDPKFVSRYVCQTLWWFPQSAESIADSVRNRLATEPNPDERIPLILCLAMQNRHLGPAPDAAFFERSRASDDAGERLSGALAQSRIRHLDESGLEVLVEALERPDALGYPPYEPEANLMSGEQLISDALLSAIAPAPLAPASKLTETQYEISELVADRAWDNVEALLEFYGFE